MYKIEICNRNDDGITLVKVDTLEEANQYLTNNGYNYIWSEATKPYWSNKIQHVTVYKLEE